MPLPHAGLSPAALHQLAWRTHNILADLPPGTLDDAVGRWTARQAGATTPLAMDGKDLRGASKQTGGGRRMMVAAVEHGTGMVLRQVEVADRSNGVPAVRDLAAGLDLAGRVVTLDAMHARHDTARCLPARRADHVVTAIRDNRKTILDDRGAIDFGGAPWHETVKAHGRLERRRCAVVDLSDTAWDGCAALHGRCRAHVRPMPRNLACLTNAAIAIVRCSGRFRYLPEANRHHAARAREALDAILIPPGA